ncbi:ABC transporter substrate-binding protein [Ktedonosporobacter rubrisoli]|nr:ABC transporter substrate-binding protein [Ktedonosporobacter rubrisoli]
MLQTLQEALIGLVAGACCGLTFAIFMYLLPTIRKAFSPLLIVSQTIPIIVLAPLFRLWFGIDLSPKVILVAMFCFFPITIASIDGIESSSKKLDELMQSMNASRWQCLWYVRLPGALPAFFSGLRIAATYAVTAAIFSEVIGAEKGLEIFIQYAVNARATDQVFAAVFVTSLLSLLLFALVLLLERCMLPWRYNSVQLHGKHVSASSSLDTQKKKLPFLNTTFVIIAVAAFIAFLLHQYAPERAFLGNTQGKMQKLVLVPEMEPTPNHTGIYVAQQKGWYRQAGIDLQILPFSSTVLPDTLVANGQADIGISTTEQIVLDKIAGQPVISIAAITAHNDDACFTLDKGNITRLRDLDGKKFGEEGVAYEEGIMREALQYDGGKGDFQKIIITTGTLQAVLTGEVDFSCEYGLSIREALYKGMKLKVFPLTEYGVPDYYTPNFITSPSLLKEKFKLLKNFMQITQRGYEFARNEPEAAAHLLMQGTAAGTFPDTGLLENVQAYLSHRYTDPGQPWGIQKKRVWDAYIHFVLAKGLLRDKQNRPVKQLDASSLFTNICLQPG